MVVYLKRNTVYYLISIYTYSIKLKKETVSMKYVIKLIIILPKRA